MNLMAITEQIFSQYPGKSAIINQQDRVISFGEFEHQVGKVVALLRSQGVQRGSKVILFLPFSIELYLTMAALFRLGAVAIFIDPWAQRTFLEQAVNSLRPDFLIAIPKSWWLLWPIRSIWKIARKISWRRFTKVLNDPDAPVDKTITDVEADDPALITFTTGSTGLPKGIERTHGFLLAQHRAHEEYFQHQPGEVDLCMLPIFVLSNLASGMTSVLANLDLKKLGEFRPAKLVAQIRKWQVNSVTCSPALIGPLVKYCEQQKTVLPSITKFFTGGAPVNPLLFEDLQLIMPQAALTLIYGSSEAEPIATLSASEVLDLCKEVTLQGKGVALGRVVDKLQCVVNQMTGPSASLRPVPDGTVGEIVLAGPFVGTRYFQNPQAFTENKIVDQQGQIWHRTGDLGYRGTDGILYMVGRKNSVITENEKHIFPLQVEPIVNAIPGVARSAFFQYSAEFKQTGLVVELHPDFAGNRHQLQEFILEALRNHNVYPQFFRFCGKIPLDQRHNAKVDYQKILEKHAGTTLALNAQSPYWHRIFAYTQERFPLPAIFLFVLLFCFNTFYTAQLLGSASPFVVFSWKMIAGFVSLFGTFFSLRLLDEFKDFQEDCVAYPKRLLSQGIVTLRDLKKLLFGIFSGQLLINLFLGPFSLVVFLLASGYGLLMFKEFFLRAQLKKSIGAYLITHQLILPFLIVYEATIVFPDWNSFTQQVGLSCWSILALLVISLPSTIYELARKIWPPTKEHHAADSYSKVWGAKRASMVLMVLNVGLYFLFFLLGFVFHFSPWSLCPPIILLGFGVLANLNFYFQQTITNSKLIELSGSLILLGMHLNMIIGVLRSALFGFWE